MKTFESDGPGVVEDTVQVGFSEYVTAAQGQTIQAYGLGSSVGILIRDESVSVGGMAVAVLPAVAAGSDSVGAKYADSATSELLEAVLDAGGDYETVEALLVGGATILEFDDLTGTVGRENVAAARGRFENLGVPVVGTDVDGDQGRIVRFDTASGAVRVTRADGSTREL